jgi:predicted ribosomally synthesized peptide with nif11-like leader
MSDEQLVALLAQIKKDPFFREKLKAASDLDDALTLAKDAGFDVSKGDWLRYQAKQILELRDEELEGIAGGKASACTCHNSWS